MQTVSMFNDIVLQIPVQILLLQQSSKHQMLFFTILQLPRAEKLFPIN